MAWKYGKVRNVKARLRKEYLQIQVLRFTLQFTEFNWEFLHKCDNLK